MANISTSSAFFGQPPISDRDLNIVRGIYRLAGLNDTALDPERGIFFAPREPVGYVHEDKQAVIIAGMAIVISVIVIITCARLLVKMRGDRTRFGWDDWVLIPAACLAAIYPMLQIYMVVDAGGGRHTWENTYEDYVRFQRFAQMCSMIFYVAVALVKISITLFVRRLAACLSTSWRLFVDAFMFTIIAGLVGSVVWSLLMCNPVQASWDVEFAGSLPEPPRCGNFSLMTKVLSVVHVVQGVVLLATPVIILWKAPMDAAKKLRMFIVWWFGAVTVLGGLLQQLAVPTSNGDWFYEYTTILAWATLDLTMGILTASLPTLDTAIIGGWKAAKSTVSGLVSGSGTSTAGVKSKPQKSNSLPTAAPIRPLPGRSMVQGQWDKGSESTEFILRDRGSTLEMHIIRGGEVRQAYEFVEIQDGIRNPQTRC